MTEIKRAEDPENMTEGEKKHTPVIEKEGDTVTVKVGEITHPMEEEHFIEYIELFIDGESLVKSELKPGDEPKAVFTSVPEGEVKAQALCNIHGLWESL